MNFKSFRTKKYPKSQSTYGLIHEWLIYLSQISKWLFNFFTQNKNRLGVTFSRKIVTVLMYSDILPVYAAIDGRF